MLKPIFFCNYKVSLKKRSFVIPLQTKILPFFLTDIGGTHPSPLYGHLPKNLSSKRAKMVLFAQIHLFFRSKKGFRIWGGPPLPPFTDNIFG